MGMHIGGQDLSVYNSAIYGLEWNKTTDVYTRLKAAEGKTQASFNDYLPWLGMRRCNLSDAGEITAYYGDPAYKDDGSNGQVMVIIPKFYYRVEVTASGYRWYVSPIAVPGFKVHPAFIRDGVIREKIFVGAYEASAYDVTAPATEVNTITVTAEATADGNVTVKLDGNNTFAIAVLNGDTADQVAAKLRAAIYNGYQQSWIPSGSGADCILTCSKSGLKTTATFSGGATGVTATVAKTVAGAGGYMLNDPAGRDNTAGTGDKLASVADVKPISGWNTPLTIANARTLAHNRGAGWEIMDFLTASAIQLLHLIEYASFNSQNNIGSGVTAVTDDGATNMAVYTGQTKTLGNLSGAATGQTHYQTGQAANSVSYRGIENFWGNIWKFIDGINVKANRNPWIADHDFASDTFAHPYVDSGLTLCATDGWVTDIAIDSDNDYQFLPSAVGGSSSTKLCDYYYQAAGNKIALLGSYWIDGANVGAWDWNLDNGSGSSARYIGACLCIVEGIIHLNGSCRLSRPAP
ncbi:MAG: hypothetical protein H5T41_02575 [Methanomassiliicoccales archaeon]|nr:hypothetical protein [Methanomassiliicoccales archaeon]